MCLIVFCLFFIGVFGSPVFAGCFILTLWETVRQARKRKAAHGGFPIGWLAATVLSALPLAWSLWYWTGGIAADAVAAA